MISYKLKYGYNKNAVDRPIMLETAGFQNIQGSTFNIITIAERMQIPSATVTHALSCYYFVPFLY